MKNFFLMMLCASAWSTMAQSPLEKGKFQLNTGIGTSGWGTPIYAGVDYGLLKNFTLGGELSYRSHDYGYGAYKYKSSIFGLGINGNYHFGSLLDLPNKWDLYGGLGLTYYHWNYDDNNFRANDDTDLGLGAQIGARYFFSDRFGLNLELGGGNATNGAKLGITYKL